MNDHTEKKEKRQLPTLKPKLYEENEFFIADEIEINSFRSESDTMEHPFFALKNGDTKNRIYQNGNVRIDIRPSSLGIATIFDKDIWIYAISKMQQAINQGLKIDRVIYFTLYDFLKTTNRKVGGRNYKEIEDSLSRLRETTITTTIEVGDKTRVSGVGLIDSFDFIKEKKGSLDVGLIEVVLPKWLFDAMENKRVLKISPDYFRIRKAIDRRVYEIARKHCGNKKEFVITLDKLFLKSGSASSKKEFKRSIKELTEKNDLPDYEIFLDVKTELVTFKNRNYTPKLLANPTLEELKLSETYHLYESILFAFECLEQKKIELTEKEIDFLNVCKSKFEQTKELKLTKKQEEWFLGIHNRKGTLKNKVVEVAKEIPFKKVNKNNDIELGIELKEGTILIGSVTKNEYKINEYLFIFGADYQNCNRDGLGYGSNKIDQIVELINSQRLIIKE